VLFAAPLPVFDALGALVLADPHAATANAAATPPAARTARVLCLFVR
jgi:hypothetical protein